MSGTSVVTKMHFIFGLVMFLFIAMMVVEDDLARRAMLLLPIIIFDIITKMLYSMDQIDRLDAVLDKFKGEEEFTITDNRFRDEHEGLFLRLEKRARHITIPAMG